MSERALTFEPVTEQDAETYIGLERKVVNARIYGPALETAKAIDEIRSNEIYFIRKSGAVIGIAGSRTRPDGSVYINNVNIDPAYQRQGIARAAMEFLLSRHQGAVRIDLVTHPENEGALKLYQSLGFKVESRKENYFGDGEPRLILALPSKS